MAELRAASATTTSASRFKVRYGSKRKTEIAAKPAVMQEFRNLLPTVNVP
jgi:hypothetical protein